MSETEWKPIETAPKDGTKVLASRHDYLWPEVVYWQEYDAETREETGEDGYWAFAGELLANVADPFDADTLPTHWQPLPEPPQPKDTET